MTTASLLDPRMLATMIFEACLTEPLSKKELAGLFDCSRNQVKTLVLDKYPHHTLGSKFRMHLKDMPPTYFLKYATLV